MAERKPQTKSKETRTTARTPRKGDRSVSTPGTPVTRARSPEQVESASTPSQRKRLTPAQKLSLVLDTIKGLPDYTLGDFLAGLFDPDSLTSPQTRGVISGWLRGTTDFGTRPVEVIEQIYSHPYSVNINASLEPSLQIKDFRDYRNSESPTRIDSKVFPTAKNSAGVPFLNSRGGLQQWAAKIMVDNVDQESESLVDNKGGLNRGAKLTWDRLRDFSMEDEVEKIQTLAPYLWVILCTMAAVDKLPRSESNKSNENLMGVTLCIFLLMNFRNRLVNFLAAFFGVFLFACNTTRNSFRILNCLGVSSAHSTILDRLHELGASAKKEITEMGQNATARPFLVVYDNINKYRPAWRQAVGKEAELKSGTAATAIIMEDVPAGAFNFDSIDAKKAEKGRNNLTVDVLLQDIDHKHLENVTLGLLLRIATSCIPGLSHLKEQVKARFETPAGNPDNLGYAKDRLRKRASQIVPLGCSGISEATATGNSDVLDDLFKTQLEMPDSFFEQSSVLVCGDQLTIDRLRRLTAYVEDEKTSYAQRQWVMPLIQLWHMKWAFLKAIYKTHYSDVSPGKNPQGLRAYLESIRRKINAKKCDFYPAHSGIQTVFESLVLTALLNIVEERFAHRPSGTRKLNPLEELKWFFSEAGPLNNCPIEQLDSMLADVYARWMTTDAHSYAIDPETNSLSLDSEDHGDGVLANTILLMRDAAWYLEFCAAVAEGDIGRVLEVIKVLRFYFWGSGSTNYGNEVLELACGFLYDFPDALKQAICQNWLVNPSGLDGHWHELDLLQEHHNLWIKRIFNSSSSDFDSKFLREAVSLNVAGFGWARKAVISMLGLGATPVGDPDTDFSADLTALSEIITSNRTLSHIKSRASDSGSSSDNYALGIDRLKDGQLATFVARSLENNWESEDGTEAAEEAETNEEQLVNPITISAGAMVADLFDYLNNAGDSGI